MVYDFDDTIFSGDSSMKFYKYCLLRHPIVILSAPKQIGAFFKFVFGKYNKVQTKSVFFSYISHLKDLSGMVEKFWNKNESGIKQWYKEHCKDIMDGKYDIDGTSPNTCVISASPEFIIQPICSRLGIDYVISTHMNTTTGQVIGENCHGKEKPRRLDEEINEYEIIEFYSDSYSDDPVAQLSKQSFLVQGEELIPWNIEDTSKEKRTFVKSALSFKK